MKLFLAPIQSLTIACYRNAFNRIFGGFDAYYAPFIATTDIKKINNSLLKDILPERNDAAVNLVPQLLSSNGNDFKLYASALADMGYKEINWNIGCPFPMVTNKKRGSGILPYPDMIKNLLDFACSDSSYTISVKMRLGLTNTEEGLRVIEVLNQYPLAGVIIHARTGIQRYTGNVDLASFEALSSSCKHEVTYNGDIYTYDDFVHISSRFPAIKNFMLGRGALSDPFLPAAIKGKTIPSSAKMNMVREFHDEVFNYYKSILSGENHLCDKMKEFWVYMSVHTDKEGKFIKKIKKCHKASDYLEAANKIFNLPEGWIEN